MTCVHIFRDNDYIIIVPVNQKSSISITNYAGRNWWNDLLSSIFEILSRDFQKDLLV